MIASLLNSDNTCFKDLNSANINYQWNITFSMLEDLKEGEEPSPLIPNPKPKTLESLLHSITQINQACLSPLKHIVWTQQDVIIFVSGMSIIQYDVVTHIPTVLKRNSHEGEIVLFKAVGEHLSHRFVGYVTRVNGRYQLIYLDFKRVWVVAAVFDAAEEEELLDVRMLSLNYFLVLLRTKEGKKMLVFRDHFELEFETDDEKSLLFVAPCGQDQLFALGAHSIQQFEFDRYMLGDMNVVAKKSLEYEGQLLEVLSWKQCMLVFTTREVLVVDERMSIERIETKVDLSGVKAVQIEGSVVLLVRGDGLVRMEIVSTAGELQRLPKYQLRNHLEIPIKMIHSAFLGIKGKQVLITTGDTASIQLLDLEAFKRRIVEDHNRHLNLPLQTESHTPISLIKPNLSRKAQLYYLKDGKLFQNLIQLLPDQISVYSLSDNGLFVLVVLQHYYRIHYVGKGELFEMESTLLPNIIDAAFCCGNQYLLLMRNQLRVYKMLPSELVYSWTGKFTAMELDKNKETVVVYEQTGSIYLYDLLTFTKLRELKIPKYKPITFDFLNQILLGYNDGVVIYDLKRQLNSTLQYSDSAIPTSAAITPEGFVAIGTHQGNVRIHKWPPEGMFIYNFREIKLFSTPLVSLVLEPSTKKLVAGSSTGILTVVQLSFEEAQFLEEERLLLTKIFIVSKVRDAENKTLVAQLENKLTQAKSKYEEETNEIKLREYIDYNEELESGEFIEVKKKVKGEAEKVKGNIVGLGESHDLRLRTMKEEHLAEIHELILAKEAHEAKLIKSKDDHLKEMASKTREYAGEMESQLDFHQSRQQQFNQMLNPSSLIQDIDQQIKQDDDRNFERTVLSSLQQLQSWLSNQKRRNIELRVECSSLPEQIWKLESRIMGNSQKYNELLREVALLKTHHSRDVEKLRKEVRELGNMEFPDLTKCKLGDWVREEADRALELERQIEILRVRETKEVEEALGKMLERLKEEADVKSEMQEIAEKKNKQRVFLKERLGGVMKREMETKRKLQLFFKEVLTVKQNLFNDKDDLPKHKRRPSRCRSMVKSVTLPDCKQVVQQREFQQQQLMRLVRAGNKKIVCRNLEWESLLTETYKLKKETAQSEMQLRFLRRELPNTQIKRIEAKKVFKQIELKPTPFQQYHKKRRVFHTQAHSPSKLTPACNTKTSTPLTF